jgi:hypothetical protein
MVTRTFLGNLLPLRDALETAPEAFRNAAWSALADRGFDVTSDLPNLQLAGEVLEALDSLGNDTEAQHLRETLRHARSQGVLVDLGEEPRRKPNARPKPGVQAAPSGAERAQSAV